MPEEKKSVLIADPDLTIYDKFKNDPLWSKVNFVFADTGAQAQSLIKENKNEYCAVLVSPELRQPDGISVIKFSLTYQPTKPVYLIESMRSELIEDYTEEELGVRGSFAKPFMPADLAHKLGPALEVFDLGAALEISQSNSDKLNEELEETDPNFRQIKAELFISGSKSLFDVYVKIRKDKFIKILQGGDVFDVSRVMEYIKKGVVNFYIRKEALESYVGYCDRLTQAISKNQKIPLQKKFSFVFNQAEVTLNSMVDMGVDNDSIVYAQRYLKNVCGLLDTYAQDSSFLSGLMKELALFEHSGAVVLVSSVIAKEAGIETDKGVQNLGLAAFLHDVGLIEEADDDDMYSDGQDKILDEIEIVMKLESKKVFGDEKSKLEKLWRQHPERGARLIEQEKMVNPLVPQIIRQHHSQRDKREGRLKGGAIHPMAEILELSDTFVRLSKQYNEGDAANKKLFISKLLEAIAEFPKRTREPFMKAFKLM